MFWGGLREVSRVYEKTLKEVLEIFCGFRGFEEFIGKFWGFEKGG